MLDHSYTIFPASSIELKLEVYEIRFKLFGQDVKIARSSPGNDRGSVDCFFFYHPKLPFTFSSCSEINHEMVNIIAVGVVFSFFLLLPHEEMRSYQRYEMFFFSFKKTKSLGTVAFGGPPTWSWFVYLKGKKKIVHAQDLEA